LPNKTIDNETVFNVSWLLSMKKITHYFTIGCVLLAGSIVAEGRDDEQKDDAPSSHMEETTAQIDETIADFFNASEQTQKSIDEDGVHKTLSSPTPPVAEDKDEDEDEDEESTEEKSVAGELSQKLQEAESKLKVIEEQLEGTKEQLRQAESIISNPYNDGEDGNTETQTFAQIDNAEIDTISPSQEKHDDEDEAGEETENHDRKNTILVRGVSTVDNGPRGNFVEAGNPNGNTPQAIADEGFKQEDKFFGLEEKPEERLRPRLPNPLATKLPFTTHSLPTSADNNGPMPSTKSEDENTPAENYRPPMFFPSSNFDIKDLSRLEKIEALSDEALTNLEGLGDRDLELFLESKGMSLEDFRRLKKLKDTLGNVEVSPAITQWLTLLENGNATAAVRLFDKLSREEQCKLGELLRDADLQTLLRQMENNLASSGSGSSYSLSNQDNRSSALVDENIQQERERIRKLVQKIKALEAAKDISVQQWVNANTPKVLSSAALTVVSDVPIPGNLSTPGAGGNFLSSPQAPPLNANNSNVPQAPPLIANDGNVPQAPPLIANNSNVPQAPPLLSSGTTSLSFDDQVKGILKLMDKYRNELTNGIDLPNWSLQYKCLSDNSVLLNISISQKAYSLEDIKKFYNQIELTKKNVQLITDKTQEERAKWIAKYAASFVKKIKGTIEEDEILRVLNTTIGAADKIDENNLGYIWPRTHRFLNVGWMDNAGRELQDLADNYDKIMKIEIDLGCLDKIQHWLTQIKSVPVFSQNNDASTAGHTQAIQDLVKANVDQRVVTDCTKYNRDFFDDIIVDRNNLIDEVQALHNAMVALRSVWGNRFSEIGNNTWDSIKCALRYNAIKQDVITRGNFRRIVEEIDNATMRINETRNKGNQNAQHRQALLDADVALKNLTVKWELFSAKTRAFGVGSQETRLVTIPLLADSANALQEEHIVAKSLKQASNESAILSEFKDTVAKIANLPTVAPKIPSPDKLLGQKNTLTQLCDIARKQLVDSIIGKWNTTLIPRCMSVELPSCLLPYCEIEGFLENLLNLISFVDKNWGHLLNNDPTLTRLISSIKEKCGKTGENERRKAQSSNKILLAAIGLNPPTEEEVERDKKKSEDECNVERAAYAEANYTTPIYKVLCVNVIKEDPVLSDFREKLLSFLKDQYQPELRLPSTEIFFVQTIAMLSGLNETAKHVTLFHLISKDFKNVMRRQGLLSRGLENAVDNLTAAYNAFVATNAAWYSDLKAFLTFVQKLKGDVGTKNFSLILELVYARANVKNFDQWLDLDGTARDACNKARNKNRALSMNDINATIVEKTKNIPALSSSIGEQCEKLFQLSLITSKSPAPSPSKASGSASIAVTGPMAGGQQPSQQPSGATVPTVDPIVQQINLHRADINAFESWKKTHTNNQNPPNTVQLTPIRVPTSATDPTLVDLPFGVVTPMAGSSAFWSVLYNYDTSMVQNAGSPSDKIVQGFVWAACEQATAGNNMTAAKNIIDNVQELEFDNLLFLAKALQKPIFLAIQSNNTDALRVLSIWKNGNLARDNPRDYGAANYLLNQKIRSKNAAVLFFNGTRYGMICAKP
jgi:hypothetical protein